jgi:hypothetical protein
MYFTKKIDIKSACLAANLGYDYKVDCLKTGNRYLIKDELEKIAEFENNKECLEWLENQNKKRKKCL